MKNVKQVSRLTGALLARKGAAIPSQIGKTYNEQVINRFSSDKGDIQKDNSSIKEKGLDKAVTTKENNLEKNHIQKVSFGKKISKKSTDKTVGVNKRIAMTLRMDKESHLELRLFSAHTRKSCQSILSEALELYLAHNKDKYQK